MRLPAVLALGFALLFSVTAQAELVKKSKSGICHDTGSPYYERTKNFVAYDSLDQCLKSGGRLPKGYKGNTSAVTQSTPRPAASSHNTQPVPSEPYRIQHAGTGYDRSKFQHWIDDDHDCLDTRAELLMKLSTSTVDTGSNHCTVDRGRWNDPYTGKIFYVAHDLDIDHLVPLKWAWEHGADHWSNDQRRIFANDEVNLFAVQASVNREKGAQGPLEWLPPNKAFQCQYILRFIRVTKTYRLEMSDSEARAMDSLRVRMCK